MDESIELSEFCRREHPRLVRALTSFCGDRVVAEELAQEALVKTCEHWRRVSNMAAPSAWAHRVAMNLATSTFRRRAAERRALARAGSADRHVDVDVPELLALRTALAHLGERRRKVVVLRHVAQLSVSETAAVLGMSENAVRSMTSRALAELRAALEDNVEVHHVR
ncbi:MAG: sigma-70 family RNA polymerase sigma factor [Actinobacteria bacterium]|nr:sigma-70 family RNA polymerase sigma factor [Actinomycetota bacterium]